MSTGRRHGGSWIRKRGAGGGVLVAEGGTGEGMGFENKHLLEKMKGRNWCYTEAFNSHSVWEGLSTLSMVNSCFHLVLNVELVSGTQDRCEVYPILQGLSRHYVGS